MGLLTKKWRKKHERCLAVEFFLLWVQQVSEERACQFFGASQSTDLCRALVSRRK